MKKLSIALCLAGISSGSVAQMASTNCMAMGSMVNCNTIGGGGGDDHSLEVLASVIHNASEASVRSKIGKMVAAGQCEEARSYALQKGRLELASSVTQLCQTHNGLIPMQMISAQQRQPASPPSRQAAIVTETSMLSPYQQGRLLADQQLEEAATPSGTQVR